MMEWFIEFESDVSVEELQKIVSERNPDIMILRRSKLTGTVKIRTKGGFSKREFKSAFLPFKIKKIYNDFPVNFKKTEP